MPSIESESMTVIRLTEAETEILREIVEILDSSGSKPKLLSHSQEQLLEDIRYGL